MKSTLEYQKNFTEIGKNKLIENIKILLYKENNNIFEILDFEDDKIYQEPLLFAYFNSNKVDKIALNTILYGYIKPGNRPKQLQVKSDRFGRIYLPNLGWLITKEKEQLFVLIADPNNDFFLVIHGEKIDFKFEPLEIIEGTAIELLKYPIPLLEQCYYDVDEELIDVEIENIAKQHLQHITIAWNLIKNLIPKHYELITSITKKSVIFNVDTTLRNSFASLKAQGTGFFNTYQKDYNEVFFMDDIVHQTGHLIFFALIYDLPDFIQVDPDTTLESLELENNTTETRNIHVVFHALYTYYTTFICLDAYLDIDDLEISKKHEALGRMYFYIGKCYQDLLLIDNPIEPSGKSQEIFTEKGLIIYNEIKSTFNLMKNKWYPSVKDFDMSNQPYNFTYSKFVELNTLYENVH